jgi:hypothetical protein
MALLGHRNTATTKKLDFKNSHLTSVGARYQVSLGIGRTLLFEKIKIATAITTRASSGLFLLAS